MKQTLFVALAIEAAIISGDLRTTNSFVVAPSRNTPCLFRMVSTSPQDLQLPPVSSEVEAEKLDDTMPPLESEIRKISMMTYIASMFLALPLSLSPVALLNHFGLISDHVRQKMALDVGQACARNLLKIMPFYELQVISDVDKKDDQPEPRIWVCNHVSMLDTFVLLASDLQLRGPNKRPIKVVYWKGLEANPVINMMFRLCGFIPVEMEANGAGEPNIYDIGSFKTLLRKAKKAFQDGFDILVLPEGQLNPWPEKGLLDIFPGAYKLSLMSKRKIQLVALHGTHKLWHADESIGMNVIGRQIKMRAYSPGRSYESATDFEETFRTVVGHFGVHGEDLPKDELEKCLNGCTCKVKERDTPFNNSQIHIDDAEKEILSVLQRETADAALCESLLSQEELDQFRHPVGIHTSKPPLILHELASRQIFRKAP